MRAAHELATWSSAPLISCGWGSRTLEPENVISICPAFNLKFARAAEALCLQFQAVVMQVRVYAACLSGAWFPGKTRAASP